MTYQMLVPHLVHALSLQRVFGRRCRSLCHWFGFPIGHVEIFFGNIECISVLVVFRFSSDKIILNTNKEAHHIFIAVIYSSLLYTLAGFKSGNIDQLCFLLIASFLTNETLRPVYLIFVWSLNSFRHLLVFGRFSSIS